MQKLVELYKQWKGEEPQDVVRLTAGGSNREYYRLTDSQGVSVVGCVGTSRDENHAFVYLAKHFTKKQLPVPEILAVSDDELRYIQTDLGNTSLFDAIRGGREAGGRYNVKEVDLLRLVPTNWTSSIAIRSLSSTPIPSCSTSTTSNTVS